MKRRKTLIVAAVAAAIAAIVAVSMPIILQAAGLHPRCAGTTHGLAGKRALIITTSHGTLGDTGKARGVYASGMTVPYYRLRLLGPRPPRRWLGRFLGSWKLGNPRARHLSGLGEGRHPRLRLPRRARLPQGRRRDGRPHGRLLHGRRLHRGGRGETCFHRRRG